MITRFKRSWELFKASITVTLRYRKLLWFPILTTFATAFIAFWCCITPVIVSIKNNIGSPSRTIIFPRQPPNPNPAIRPPGRLKP